MYREDRLCASFHHHPSIHLFWISCSTHNHDNCLPKLSDICRSCLVVLAAMFPKWRPMEGEPRLNSPNCPAQLSPFNEERDWKQLCFSHWCYPTATLGSCGKKQDMSYCHSKAPPTFLCSLSLAYHHDQDDSGISLQSILENMGAGQDQGLLTVIGNGKYPILGLLRSLAVSNCPKAQSIFIVSHDTLLRSP